MAYTPLLFGVPRDTPFLQFSSLNICVCVYMLHLQMLVDDKHVALEWRARDARVPVAAPDAAARTFMRKTTYGVLSRAGVACAHGHIGRSFTVWVLDGGSRCSRSVV